MQASLDGVQQMVYHFHKILRVFYCEPQIDLFASCLNYQIPKYVSWHSDENAAAIDAFSISWSNLYLYALPLFSLIGENF